jgi:integrase
MDAAAWLAAQAKDVARGIWTAPVAAEKVSTLRAYADTWLDSRPLKPRTRAEYRRLLDTHILPPLGDAPVDRITTATVRAWYAQLNSSTPTRKAHAYALLRTIFTTAFEHEVVDANPCRIRGAGAAKTAHQSRPATLDELEVIVAAIAARYRAMVLLAAWCGLRFGELAELRRADVDLDGGVLRVTRGVTRTAGQVHIGDPKSDAGRRTVAIPPHLLPVLTGHLENHVGEGADSLLFPARHGGNMAPASLYKVWYPARKAAGRDDLRFHDLRHTGATLFAATGATLADVMSRIGHSTPAAAMRYQHASAERDRAGADALSALVTGK